MSPGPPSSTCTDTLFRYTTLFRSRYKPGRTCASCHASKQPKDDDDGTALRHGLAADRGVRAADRLSCGHGVRALELPREDRAPADLGGDRKSTRLNSSH